MNIYNKTKILQDKVPSLFIVTSPFQAMCAMEAIATMEISNYLFIISCGKDSRDKQLYQYLDDKGIVYVVEEIKGKRYLNNFLATLFHHPRTSIHRAFLGDTDNMYQYLCAYKYLSNNSVIAFMDDGTKNIPVLMGKRKRKMKNKYFLCEWIIRKILNIRITNSFFTLFYDIATENFECRQNTFAHLAISTNQNAAYGVYYIGTNSIAYCKKLMIGFGDYIKSLEEQLKAIKERYKYQPIYYIPHGRDTNKAVESLCVELGINYIRASKTVELFIMEQASRPIAIYASTSTALLILKKIYPSTTIYNIFFNGNLDSEYYKDYVMYSEYFSKHGIPLISNVIEI